MHAGDAASAAESSVSVIVQRAAEVSGKQLIEADGYLFICPENLGSMSGEMKEFFDQNYYPCLEKLNGRPYGIIICAGSDGQGAVRQVERIATGWRLNAVMPAAIIHTSAQSALEILAPKQLTPEQKETVSEIGAGLSAGLALGVF
ncbi:MAG: NAD(P)H-dependent oxidoreductase [Burkholderiaceae bacterium]